MEKICNACITEDILFLGSLGWQLEILNITQIYKPSPTLSPFSSHCAHSDHSDGFLIFHPKSSMIFFDFSLIIPAKKLFPYAIKY